MNSSGFKPRQLHPHLVCASEGICWPVSCFTHNLMWRAHHLLDTGDDSVSLKTPEMVDVEELD